MYSLRFNMVVAMSCAADDTQMETLAQQGVKGPTSRPSECIGKAHAYTYVHNTTLRLRSVISGPMHSWDKKTQSSVINSFFWGYLMTQIPGGWLSQKYGGKRFFGWATFGSGVVTLLIPYAAMFSYSAVISIRVILGLLQGVTLPAVLVVWSQWAPPLERQKLINLSLSGSTFGIILTYPSVSIMCHMDKEGWGYIFYISGAVTITWCVLWYYYVHDTPSKHPRITQLEKAYIHNCLRHNMPLKETHITPWLEMMSSPPIWAYILTHMASTFQLYGLMSYMTIYLQDVHYFSKTEAANTVVTPYIALFASSNFFAAVYDLVIAKKICSRTVARKTGNSIGFLGVAVLLIFVGFLDCTQSNLAVATMTAVNTFAGVYYGTGFSMNLFETAPQHIGVLFGISNTLATLSGLVSLIIIKELTANRLRSEWQIAFLIGSAIFVMVTVIFIVFGSGELQKWAKIPEDKKVSITESATTSTSVQITKLRDTAGQASRTMISLAGDKDSNFV